MKLVVYTAITGGRDRLLDPPRSPGVECVAFLDCPQPGAGWEVRPACSLFVDPCRNAKIHKVLAHRYFPDADISLWLDGNIVTKGPLEQLIERCLQTADIALHRHPDRDCLYDEARYCISTGLDEPAVIEAQMNRYRATGYPPHRGLVMAGVILRRHTPRIEALNDMWWAEVCAGSRRDQLSFNYVAHRLSVPYSEMPGTLSLSQPRNDNAWFDLLTHCGDRSSPGRS